MLLNRSGNISVRRDPPLPSASGKADRERSILVRTAPGLSVVLALAFVLVAPRCVWAFTPDSPEVQDMLERAVAFLDKGEDLPDVGGQCLVAMALLKTGRDHSDPLVKKAIANARKRAAEVAKNPEFNHIYNETISCIFLCELNPKTYAAEINILLQAIIKRQLPNGPWSYYPTQYDDTSQTQYGVLCYWAAHQAGFAIPPRGVESALHWFLRTQNLDGSFVYRPRDSGTYQRQDHGTESQYSMSAAGLGSIYICEHLLGMGADAQRAVRKDDKPSLPPALQKIETGEEKKKPPRYLPATNTNPQQVRQATQLGNAWFDKHMTYDIKKWTHYYMYAVERCRSFQEVIEGKVVPEPAWYNDGVKFLQQTQGENGEWITLERHGGGNSVDTAFAVLFLVRSSQTTLRRAANDEGILIGGMGLPRDLTNARIHDGKVVTPQMVRDVDDLLELLGSTEQHDFDATLLPGGLSLDEDLTKRTSQLERLRELVTNENFEARLAAVKTLGRSRNLDNVPALIYALSDPDGRVVEAARGGLSFISRKFQGYGPPPGATPPQIQAAQDKWREWYRSIRPEGELLD